ncbi:MAG: CPBP family intramembrane glutamic endopeptidase [Thermoproteus sp.]
MTKTHVDLLVLVASLAALAVKPASLGYLLALAISSISFARLNWLGGNSAYLPPAVAVYLAAFVADLLTGVKSPPADILTADVLAPIVEEVVFRGLAFRVLPRWGALLVSTAVFALLHPYPLLALAYAVALTLAYMGGGLAASIALHAANNAIWTAIYLGFL